MMRGGGERAAQRATAKVRLHPTAKRAWVETFVAQFRREIRRAYRRRGIDLSLPCYATTAADVERAIARARAQAMDLAGVRNG